MKWAAFALALLISATPSRAAERPVWDGKTWDFSLINGTTEEVGEKVNRDVRRLRIRCAEIQENLTLEQRRLSGLRTRRIEALHASAEYQSKLTEADQTEKDLDASRKAHTGALSVTLSSKLNHLKSDLAAMEATALSSDSDIKKSAEQAAVYGRSLGTFKESLSQAEKWRAEVVDAMKNTLALRWPLTKGSKGLLIKTKSMDELRDAIVRTGSYRTAKAFDNMMIGYAMEWEKTVAEHEKITTNQVTFHPFVTSADNNSKTVAYEVVAVDKDPIESILIGVNFIRVTLMPRPEDPISQLMKAIGD